MKKHPEYGWAVLRSLPGFERAALDILHHHENHGGAGYPAGLKETEIPVVSRIVSVIDAFEGMVSSRPYRNGLPPDEAIRRLLPERARMMPVAFPHEPCRRSARLKAESELLTGAANAIVKT